MKEIRRLYVSYTNLYYQQEFYESNTKKTVSTQQAETVL